MFRKKVFQGKTDDELKEIGLDPGVLCPVLSMSKRPCPCQRKYCAWWVEADRRCVVVSLLGKRV